VVDCALAVINALAACGFAIAASRDSQKIYFLGTIRHPKDTFNPNIFISSHVEKSHLLWF
jgi:hypothetical protein